MILRRESLISIFLKAFLPSEQTDNPYSLGPGAALPPEHGRRVLMVMSILIQTNSKSLIGIIRETLSLFQNISIYVHYT